MTLLEVLKEAYRTKERMRMAMFMSPETQPEKLKMHYADYQRAEFEFIRAAEILATEESRP